LSINKIHYFIALSVVYGTWKYLDGLNEPLRLNILHTHTSIHNFFKLKNEVGVIRINPAILTEHYLLNFYRFYHKFSTNTPETTVVRLSLLYHGMIDRIPYDLIN
jgi:hypothetical protein